MGFFDNIGKTLSDVGQSTIQKGKEVADVVKYNSLVTEEEKKIANVYEQIGKHYVEIHGEEKEDTFVEYLEILKASKDKILEYQQKLKELRGVSKCPTCGAEVPNGSLFCASCGTKMVAAPTGALDISKEEKHCSGCGAVIPTGSKFCTSCGKPVAVENSENTTSDADA